MTTARDIITTAAQILGVIRKGESLDDDEAQDALDALNGLIGSWSSDNLITLGKYREFFTLTANAEHSIGSGQTFDTATPTKILEAFIRQGGIDYPLTIVNDYTYRAEPFKSLQGGASDILNYSKNPDDAYGVIRLYPVPNAGDSLHILSEKQLTQATGLSSAVFMPQAGWERALRYNLAIELAPMYGIEPTATAWGVARDSLARMKREAARARPLTYRPGEIHENNIYSGWLS